jgi:hypothetical protein
VKLPLSCPAADPRAPGAKAPGPASWAGSSTHAPSQGSCARRLPRWSGMCVDAYLTCPRARGEQHLACLLRPPAATRVVHRVPTCPVAAPPLFPPQRCAASLGSGRFTSLWLAQRTDASAQLPRHPHDTRLEAACEAVQLCVRARLPLSAGITRAYRCRGLRLAFTRSRHCG